MSMQDLGVRIGEELRRVWPGLKSDDLAQLVDGVGRAYREILRDSAECGLTEWEDFFDFTMLGDAGLAVVYREAGIELFPFLTNEALIHETQHLAIVEVDEFLAVGRRYGFPEVGLRFPMSEARPWMENEGT